MKPKKLIQFDWAIKHILRNKAHFPVLEGLLSELLHTDVVIDSLLESEYQRLGSPGIDCQRQPERRAQRERARQWNKINSDDKSNRVDILAKLASGEKVIIEVQCAHQWDFFSRMLYGASKVVVEYLKQGEEYGTISRVISVSIVYFDIGHGEDYIYHGKTDFKGLHKHDILLLSDKEKKCYPEHIEEVSNIFPEYYVLKVSEFDLKIKDTLDEWIYALQQSEVKPEFKAKGIQQAAEQLDILQLSEGERAEYEYHLGSLRDSKSYFRTYYSDGKRAGIAEGIERGIAEGELKTKIATVHNLHQIGISVEQIAFAAQLSCEDVEKILKKVD